MTENTYTDDTPIFIVRRDLTGHGREGLQRPHSIKSLQGEVVEVKAKDGIAQIELQIIDEDGNAVVNADDEITCEIAGSAKLLGMEAGNNSDVSDYTDNKQRSYHGKMIVYIQTRGKTSDEVLVRFSAP